MAKVHETWTVLPHGPIDKLSDRLWRVEGELEAMKRVMSIAKRADGTLVIHNAIAIGDAEMKEIDAFGKVSAIVVPNGWHRLDAKVFAERYPDAKVFCPAGARKRVAQVVNVDGTYEDFPNDASVQLQTLAGTKQREGVMIVRGESTGLVLNDAVFNMPHGTGFTGFVFRRITSSTGGPKVSRLFRWAVLSDKAAFRAQLEQLAKLPQLAHVVVSHHQVIVEDPAGTLARIEPTTGALSQQVTQQYGLIAESLEACDGQMYMAAREAGGPRGEKLYAINLTTGSATLRGAIGTTAIVIRMTSTTVPKIAGKMPPSVIPCSGAPRMNPRLSVGKPWTATSTKMTARITRTIAVAVPVAKAIDKSPRRFFSARRNVVDAAGFTLRRVFMSRWSRRADPRNRPGRAG